MDKIIVILGDKTDEMSRTLKSHYSESVEVINSFKTPSEFAEYYATTPVRVDRIIISEDSFSRAKYDELRVLKQALENFYVVFNQCFFLVSLNKETNELLGYLSTDETFVHRHKLKVFSHERFTAKITVDYCLNKIARKFYQDVKPEYETMVRVRKDSELTFRLDEEEEENENDIVVLDRDNVQLRQLQQKLKNLNSASKVVKDELWENNKIIKDIYKIEKLMSVAKQEKRFDIDYSIFQLSRNIKTFKNNITIVTGERRSGKTTLAYCIGKSSSNYKKTLIVDFDVDNLGLSHLAESIKDASTVMLLQTFREDFKNSLQTLIKSGSKLNMILANTKTKKELGDIDPINFLSLIVNSCSKYYDKIVFDIPLDKLTGIVPIMKKSDKVVVTVPTILSNVVSSVTTINSLNLKQDLMGEDLIFVPVDVYNKVKGIKTLERPHIKDILNKLIAPNVKVMPEIEIKSFNVDQSLAKAIEAQ